ncbi:hypothetical protein ACJJTC_013382 [Scirpophaga incertulas]
MTVDIIEPIALTSKDLAEVSISPLYSNTSDNINVQEIDAICEDSLLDDTHVEQLRRANNFDYEALGMTVPEIFIHIPDTNMTDKQTTDENTVQFEDIIDEGDEGTVLSPSILQKNFNNLNQQMDMQISSYYQESSDATDRNTKNNDSAKFGKENQKPSSPFVCLNEGSDFSADSGSEYHPPTSHPRRDKSSSTSSSIVSLTNATSKNKRGKKRVRNQNKWKENVRKTLKNSGKEYISKKGNKIEAKKMRPPCHNCKFLCCDKFTRDERQEIFNTYWSLGSLQRQRDFLNSCINIQNIVCRRVKNVAQPRKPNSWFSFVKNGQTRRICKTFLLNTLGIAQRTLRTVIEAKSSDCGIAPTDQRGNHGKQPKSDPEVLESVRQHINSVPRVESHYLRANTSREFIDGGLTLAALHRDYECQRRSVRKEAATLFIYSQIFNREFNISFFIPKKDLCNFCESYKNAEDDKKTELELQYMNHQREKVLSRTEKATDIALSREPQSKFIVAIYDLQAQLPVPIGNSSAFYYKSKLNCYNFTITNIKTDSTTCYFWHEGLGCKGSTEIGTCVYRFLEKVSEEHPNSDVIFYSDNCCGQQKNRYVFSMYHYAVENFAINSVCHKFLISGHSQNEGDNAHSLIEKSIKRAKKSGPIYVPDQYVNLIRNAKKRGNPFIVHEMHFSNFYDLKALTEEQAINYQKDTNGDIIKLSELTMIKFTKHSDFYEFKKSFNGEWIQANVKLVRRKRKQPSQIKLKKAYDSKINISDSKKNDLLQLLRSNIVPTYYEEFYNNL